MVPRADIFRGLLSQLGCLMSISKLACAQTKSTLVLCIKFKSGWLCPSEKAQNRSLALTATEALPSEVSPSPVSAGSAD